MMANFNAIAIIYIHIITGFLLLRHAEKPKFNKELLKYFTLNVIVISLYLWLLYVYLFNKEVYSIPLGQLYLPILCHLFIIIFIPKFNKYNLKILLLTIITTFILSIQFLVICNANGYAGCTAELLDQMDSITKHHFNSQMTVLGAGVIYPPYYTFKIDGDYPANWLFDSEIFEKLYSEEIKYCSTQNTKLISLEDFKKCYRFNNIVFTPFWHSFFTSIYYYKKQNLEFWHNGGKARPENIELKIRE